jgi:hypothetical protein
VNDHPKQVWFLTFGSSSPDLTEKMLADCGLDGGIVREVHVLSWRESKYVLLCFDRNGRKRSSQMKRVLALLQERFKVVSNEIYGYDSVTVNSAARGGGSVGMINVHPGFMRMVEELKLGNKNRMVSSWTKEPISSNGEGGGESGSSRKRKRPAAGFLERLVGNGSDIERMTRIELLALCRKWKPVVDGYPGMLDYQTLLEAEVEHKDYLLGFLKEENDKYSKRIMELKIRLGDL